MDKDCATATNMDFEWDDLSVDSGVLSDAEVEEEEQNKLEGKVQNSAVFWKNLSLKDFTTCCPLGGGGYAKVDLVYLSRSDEKKYFALKKISKRMFSDEKLAKHFIEERKVLLKARSRFIPTLFKVLHTSSHVHLLNEACLGRDLFSFIEQFGPLDVSTARYTVACVIEALHYLHHELSVVHRDVKMENLLIGQQGVVKLGDFGFCKTIEPGSSTFTFCGTPGYIAPEVILHKGHSYTADFFSLGVVTYELLSCHSPFRRYTPLDTYKATLRGIGDVAFPSYFDHSTRFFITSLCEGNPSRRLNSDARHHSWFDDFDWERTRSDDMISPFAHVVTHHQHT